LPSLIEAGLCAFYGVKAQNTPRLSCKRHAANALETIEGLAKQIRGGLQSRVNPKKLLNVDRKPLSIIGG
jgi:hypothetical protein